jgi:hypothetical protein
MTCAESDPVRPIVGRLEIVRFGFGVNPQELESPYTVIREGLAKQGLTSVSMAIRQKNFFIFFRRVNENFLPF